MNDIPEHYVRTIKSLLPNASAEHLRLNREGLTNDVVIVQGETVFRFPKHDWAVNALQQEARVLELIQHRIPVPVPRFTLVESNVATYDYLPGVPLTRNRLLRVEPAVRDRLVQEMLAVVRAIHSTPVDEVEAAGIGPSITNRERSWWLEFHHDLQAHLYPLLMEYQKTFVEDLFAPVVDETLDLGYESRLVHGDLAPYHLLFDPDHERLAGVIDFGTAGLGDPAVDYGLVLRTFGESLVTPALDDEERALLGRARFWAATVDLQLTLLGLRHDDRPLLVAYVGSTAPDLLPASTPADVGS